MFRSKAATQRFLLFKSPHVKFSLYLNTIAFMQFRESPILLNFYLIAAVFTEELLIGSRVPTSWTLTFVAGVLKCIFGVDDILLSFSFLFIFNSLDMFTSSHVCSEIMSKGSI